MPWNECKPMDERLRFVARLLEGEKMAPLCREFGISRVTGYKIFDRYKECGLDGLHDRSKAPYRQANKLPFQVERAILGIKKEYPTWGAPKIRDKLIREYPMIPPPAVSTIHAALDRNGLIKRRKRRCKPASSIDQRPASNVDHAIKRQAHDSHPKMSLELWSVFDACQAKILVKLQRLLTAVNGLRASRPNFFRTAPTAYPPGTRVMVSSATSSPRRATAPCRSISPYHQRPGRA